MVMSIRAIIVLFVTSLLLAGCTWSDIPEWVRAQSSAAEDGSGPRIIAFTAGPQPVDAGTSIIVEWQVEAADATLLRIGYPQGVSVVYNDLPLTGSLDIVVPPDATDEMSIELVPQPQESGRRGGERLVLPILAGSQEPIIIDQFEVSDANARPGDQIELRWAVSGAVGVSLVAVDQNGDYGPAYESLPASGTLDFTFPVDATGDYSFQLWPLPATLARTMAEVTVQISP